MSEDVIALDGVWKIFGNRADEAMQAVKERDLPNLKFWKNLAALLVSQIVHSVFPAAKYFA